MRLTLVFIVVGVLLAVLAKPGAAQPQPWPHNYVPAGHNYRDAHYMQGNVTINCDFLIIKQLSDCGSFDDPCLFSTDCCRPLSCVIIHTWPGSCLYVPQ